MELLPHQKTALDIINSRLSQGVGFLESDPAGTGKTLPGLLAARQATPSGAICLWITLASLKQQLENEIIKFSIPFKPLLLSGTKTARLNQLRAAQAGQFDLLVVNYEQLLSDTELKIFAALPISIMVCDECMRLGNQKNKTYKNILKLANYKHCKRLCMSGDPITSSPMQAFALFEFLNPASLGSWMFFVSRYMVPSMWSRAGFVRTSRLPELAEKLSPYYIRRKREDLLPDLPDLMEETLSVEMNPREAKLYGQIRSSLLLDIPKPDIDKLETPHTMDQGIVKFTRLRQLCITPELLGENHESSKLKALKEFIGTINGSKCLIFTEFASAVPYIQASLPSGSSLVIEGSTGQELRQAIVDKFQTDPAIRYLIGTKALEMGLNLQAADYVIHLDPPLTYSSYDQRCSRARRQGRNDKVISVRMVTAGSLESRIYRLIENKKNISLLSMPYNELLTNLLT